MGKTGTEGGCQNLKGIISRNEVKCLAFAYMPQRLQVAIHAFGIRPTLFVAIVLVTGCHSIFGGSGSKLNDSLAQRGHCVVQRGRARGLTIECSKLRPAEEVHFIRIQSYRSLKLPAENKIATVCKTQWPSHPNGS